MIRFSRLDKFVKTITKELENGNRKKWALKKLTTLNLPMEVYQRFEIGEFASLFVSLGFCTDLCEKLLTKAEDEQKKSRKRRMSSFYLSNKDGEPACKKMKGGSQDKKDVQQWEKLGKLRIKKIKQQLKDMEKEAVSKGNVHRRSTRNCVTKNV
ncbi:hypothetical protein CAEBREN_11514 [Caenorhabditis brenneri]|uniref:Uncharacterized protein n=1 Tax=Caenorhabditis brenneri TaxID=135651 RepID=G0MPF2_CAEBE|nr:hypothetical protein CAEBREN_11514 [Caenorhabditis brenneri]